MRRVAFLFLLAGVLHSPVSAQETYVSASVAGDVVRFSGSRDAPLPESSGGEAIGFALRLGTRLGSAWGVEAEFARPAEIRHEGTPAVIPLQTLPHLTVTAPDGTLVTIPRPQPEIFPPLSYRVRTAYRDTTVSAGVWARQALSARFALVYTGGVGFHRTEREVEFTFAPLPFPRLAGVPSLPSIVSLRNVALDAGVSASDAVIYTARPFAGVDAQIGMTDRLALVPGIRLHGLSGGLLIRPSVGLSWTF